MEQVLNLIKENNFFAPNSRVGVGVSGGADSMCLLHFLYAHRNELNIEVIAINVNHNTRKEDAKEANFVEKYCKKLGILCLKTKADAQALMEKEKLSMEEACRIVRFETFADLKKKGLIDYVALGHHLRDQAETILMHIVRGCGLKGASGMEYVNDFVVRPFLNLGKGDIMLYMAQNNVPYVVDESNFDTSISRNLIRQEVLPTLRQVWPNVDEAICNFGKTCREDDKYISNNVDLGAVIFGIHEVKIPKNYFSYPEPVVFRLLEKALDSLGGTSDFERKHFEMIMRIPKMSNGTRINLPHGINAYSEYDYVTITTKQIVKRSDLNKGFSVGRVEFGPLGEIVIEEVNEFKKVNNALSCDLAKIPANATWRIRQDGDTIEKFGGGTKKLKNYLNDKKIPVRIRNSLPVLAVGNDVLAVLGVDISDKIKVDENTKQFGIIRLESNIN